MTVLARTMTLLLLLLSMQSFAAPKHFKVTITVPPAIDEKKLIVGYYDGIKYHGLTVHLADNRLEISGDYTSYCAAIHIAYRFPGNEDYSLYDYWVTEQPATIHIVDDWAHPVLVNAQAVSEAGGDAYKASKAAAEKDRDAYWEANHEAIMKLDRPERQVLFEKMRIVDSLKLAFLRQRKNTYYALWLMEREIMWMGCVIPYGYPGMTPSQKRTLLDEVVPGKKEYASERKSILEELAGMEVGVGVKAPAFTERDMYGNKISLADYKGKYVLLNFWGSWCGPCVAELPAIKKIYETYSHNKLAVIGVSNEADSTTFLNAVDKYGVTWTKLYNSDALRQKYGVMGWPKLLLIDPSGKIVYDRKQENPETIDSLLLLQNILQQQLGK